jgi:hypothetical protein
MTEQSKQNFMTAWLDSQKKMLDYWQETVNPTEKVEEKAPSIFEESMKPFQDIIQKWVEVSSDLYSQSIRNMNDIFPQQQIVDRMLNGASLYQNLHKFWEDINLNITGKDSDALKLITRWNEEYMKFVSNYFISSLPEPMNKFFNQALEIYNMSTSATGNFFKPWLDESQNMQSLLVKSMNGDQAAYIEFNRLWREKFASSYGKIFNIPEFSMNREQMQKQMRSMQALINFINVMNEFVATIVKVNQETLEKNIKEYQEMVIAGTNPKTFKEYYEYWWKQNEAAYLKLFGTTEFSKLLSQLLDAGVNYKKEFDDLLEKQLQFLPYPSKTDMDSVYKTLDTLKRDIRALKKEVKSLKEELSKAGPKPGNTGKQTVKGE